MAFHRARAKEDVIRYWRKERCGTCATCLAPKRSRSELGNRDPCMTVLGRLEYTESERAIVFDFKNRWGHP